MLPLSRILYRYEFIKIQNKYELVCWLGFFFLILVCAGREHFLHSRITTLACYLLLACSAHTCFLSINYILVVTRIVREYPAELVVVLIRIALTSILSVPAALISEKDLKAFKLGFNMELIGALH
ncbi:uncharacterized protein [Glycine max]|uniref:uncharacterized protein isoform X1 n=1 Tax=Glycine max TaxID=3847 RepID=UPI001B3577CD|nr:uncharacterized protein LOC121175049 isoform X1 [Glycine max]